MKQWCAKKAENLIQITLEAHFQFVHLFLDLGMVKAQKIGPNHQHMNRRTTESNVKRNFR